jgi:hypothetical protein
MSSCFKKHHCIPPPGCFWKLRLAEILLKGLVVYCTEIKVCGISKFSKSVLRSSVQQSCVVKLYEVKQVEIPGP